jgi:hypothetical protein
VEGERSVGRRLVVLELVVVIVFAFAFFAPVAQVTVREGPHEPCGIGPKVYGCPSSLVHGEGSITYLLFGVGGLYTRQYDVKL